MYQPTDNLIAEKQEVKPFYVYIHRRANDGRVFYVGKGKGDRIFSKSNRNRYWHNIVNKHGFTTNMVMRFNSEECALSFEVALIKHYGRENLCNLTGGGDGIRDPSQETRKKISLSRIGKKASELSRRKMSISQTGRKHPESVKAKISSSNIGKIHSEYTKSILSDKAKLNFQGVNNPRHDKTIFHFSHSIYGEAKTTKYEWRTTYGISRSSSDNLVNGLWKSTKGWTIIR